MRRIQATVFGTVQGVFFRASTLEKAQSLRLVGSVENLFDQSVRISAQGDGEAVEELLRWAHDGPPTASVERLVVIDLKFEDALKTFAVIR